MKKVIAILVAALAFVAVASAQPRALGLRGAYGAEVSYQHTAGPGFIEADLGFVGGQGIYVSAVYDFIFASAGVANFYAGPGAMVGLHNTIAPDVNLVGQVGVEFELPNIPLNISLDWRPGFSFMYSHFVWTTFGLGIRYRF